VETKYHKKDLVFLLPICVPALFFLILRFLFEIKYFEWVNIFSGISLVLASPLFLLVNSFKGEIIIQLLAFLIQVIILIILYYSSRSKGKYQGFIVYSFVSSIIGFSIAFLGSIF